METKAFIVEFQGENLSDDLRDTIQMTLNTINPTYRVGIIEAKEISKDELAKPDPK